MATSGTVGATVINVDTLLQHAIRRCQQPAQALTPEIALAARENLYFFLSELANHQIPLWTIDYVLLGVKDLAPYYDMPVGTVDVMDVLYRNMTRISGSYASSSGGVAGLAFDGDLSTACTQTVALGNISVNAGSATTVYTYGFVPFVDSTLTLAWECSDDGSTWLTTQTIASASYTAGDWYWFDEPTPFTAQYWRVRAVAGTLDMAEVFFSVSGFDRVMYRMNRDQYAQLPYKFASPGIPSQFYFERLVPVPRFAIWPTPQTSVGNCIVAWRQRQIQDVGASVLNTVEVPSRWERAIMRQMAYDMCCELPGADQSLRSVLKAEADESLAMAWAAERDTGPILIQPNLSYYQGGNFNRG